MIDTMHDSLAQGLDHLEARGRAYLSEAARRDARKAAADWAAWATLGTAVVVLTIRLLLPIGAITALALAAAGVGCAMIGANLLSRRASSSRLDALALFDRRLGLKDRIVTTDEFLAIGRQDGFRGAALAEAALWLDWALVTPLEPHAAPAMPPGLRNRRLATGAAGLVLLALTVFIGQPIGTRISSREGDANASRNSAELSARTAALAEVVVADGISRGVGDAASGGSAAVDGAASAARRTDVGAAQASSTPPSAERPKSGAGQGAPSSGGSEPSGAAGAARLTGAAAGTDTAASARMSARNLDGAGAGGAPNALPGPGRPAATGADAAAVDRPTPPGRVPKSPSAAAAPDSVRQNGSPPGDRSNNGDGDQMGAGAGRGSNRDGLKRSRGSGSLLLAVPMEDRFIGIANTGPVRSMTRSAQRPRPAAVALAAAADRGTRRGDSGRIVRAPVSLQDQRLVRRYFQR